MGPFTITNSDVGATTSTNIYTSTSTPDQTWQASGREDDGSKWQHGLRRHQRGQGSQL